MTAPPDDTTTDLHAVVAVLQQRLDAGLAREATLAEALATRNSEYGERIEQQSATIDVLKVMSASPGNPQPVFDLIVRRARDLCNAAAAILFEFDGRLVHFRARSGYDMDQTVQAEYQSLWPAAPTRDSITCRAILDKEIIHVRDLDTECDLLPVVRRMGHKSQLSIPLLREGNALGDITLAAMEPGGFSDSQIELLKTFAQQAVIAIGSAETYRALQARTTDLQESLEYQTATSDVLKVISRSTFDLQPVLETVVKTAAQLCNADMAMIGRRQGEFWRVAANFGFPPEYEAYERAHGAMSVNPDSPSVGWRAVRERCVVHVPDVATIPEYHDASISLAKQRTSLGVPLLREGEAVGVIMLARQRVQPFTERQIELVSTFADQAVIAIENTRLLTEQREALEQQTATAEVLQVINASPGNLTPVFDAMLEKAMRLCDATYGHFRTYDGEGFPLAAVCGDPSLVDWHRQAYAYFVPGPHNPITRFRRGERLIHISDAAASEAYRGDLGWREFVDTGACRSVLAVALRKDTVLLGYISVYRREVRPFSAKQIALLENFAAQAVIAMENARLINEQREALEQQTATAEVLQIINASPGNLNPVFDAILEKAHSLCGATVGSLVTYDGEFFRAVATHGFPEQHAATVRLPVRASARHHALLRGDRFVQTPDLRAIELSAEDIIMRGLIEHTDARTRLMVPLRKDGALLGFITAYRPEVRLFSDNEIALLENFAAQAVIAMENARLLTEQQEALEQQTATAEVLQVINASPGDLAPVFEAILEKAHNLCDVAVGSLSIYLNGVVHTAATRGFSEEYQALLRRPYPAIGSHQALMRGEPSIQTPDFRSVRVRPEMASSLDNFERMNLRTGLWVPLRKDGTALGCISSYRDKVQPFSEKEIALLENFAAQAVIAMENARLLEEIRQRQAELRVTFDNMADGVAMFDGKFRLAAWNRNFQELLDIPAAVLAECPTYAEYLRILAERGEFGTEDIEAELGRRLEHTDRELRLERARPNGQVIEVRRNAVPDGGFVLIYSDITERKRSEAEIRAARDAAEAAYRDLKTAQANLIQAEKMASLGQLTAGIAHEIKNPLNFVNNFAALSVDLLDELKETAAPGFAALSEEQRAEVEDVSAMLTSNLEKITEHGKRADGIVKAMLEHSRGSSGERRVVDLNALIDEALNLAYHGARAQDQSFNVTLERDFGAGIAPIEVNPQDITRVFLNLFANGFYAVTKRARDGRDAGFFPTLKITTRDTGDAVEIHVRDNGIGIPADVRDRVFQPFFTTKPTGEGTGLGLSITYDIITQQHGGTIAADSNVGEYSEFVIRLPRNP